MSNSTFFDTEVPSRWKQLARRVVRSFYDPECVLIVDLLVRHGCMKEIEIAELLGLEKKQVRASLAVLRIDSILQLSVKTLTGADGSAQKHNCYFIDYHKMIRMVKYKLHIMRMRLEALERNSSSRAVFKCVPCQRYFTNSEADRLFDIETKQLRCVACKGVVEEETSQKNLQSKLAQFYNDVQPLYDLLPRSELTRLSAELLDPAPVDINIIRGAAKRPKYSKDDKGNRLENAGPGQGFNVENMRIAVDIGDNKGEPKEKEKPGVSTWGIVGKSRLGEKTPKQFKAFKSASKNENHYYLPLPLQNDVKTGGKNLRAKAWCSNAMNNNSSDTSDDSDNESSKITDMETEINFNSDVVGVPIVHLNGISYNLNQINPEHIARMSAQEMDEYIQVYHSHFGYSED